MTDAARPRFPWILTVVCALALVILLSLGVWQVQRLQWKEGLIREAEAVSGIETFGMRREQACFLNLPFYQTGKVKKDEIGPADVKITRELLEHTVTDKLDLSTVGDLRYERIEDRLMGLVPHEFKALLLEKPS